MKLAKAINISYNNSKMAWESIGAKVPKHALWNPPPPRLLKVNLDAAVTTNNVTLSAVCRNRIGEILSLWSHTTDPGDPLWAEAKAALFAVDKMIEEAFSYFVLEGDALNVINPLVCSLILPHWSVKYFIVVIRFKLSSDSFWSVRHFVRDSNSLAHNIVCWVSASQFQGRIPISLVPPSLLGKDGEGDGHSSSDFRVCFL
jgi:hypothetical protein